MKNLKTTNIVKITGFLLSSLLFNFAIAGGLGFSSFSDLTADAQQTITIKTIESTGSAISATENVGISVALIGLKLNVIETDISGSLLDNFTVLYIDTVVPPIVRFDQKLEYPGGGELTVTIPVSATTTSGEISYVVVADKQGLDTFVAEPPLGGNFSGAPATITGGGATPPNYSISMEISGGNNLGTVASKELPLNIAVTNIASAPNTGDVVVALAKDSRIASVGTNCGGDDWALDRTNPVAYLFTYTANDKDFPPTTSASSTIVCPVTVTRPTTQSGKLQLNAVLRHGSGDTKTSNDVASIEVTYN